MTTTPQQTPYDAEIAALEGKFDSIDLLSHDEEEELRDLGHKREGWLEAMNVRREENPMPDTATIELTQELAALTKPSPQQVPLHSSPLYVCDVCKGTGQVPLLDVRDGCEGNWPSPCWASYEGDVFGVHGERLKKEDCPGGCKGLGYVVTQDLERWLEAGADELKVIVAVRNDGPGWRCDLFKNTIRSECLATGWSDGGFHLEGPSDYKPTPMEAVLRAYDKLLKQVLVKEA